ncbi:RING-type domain-containing protein [Meloidogyne graminicola]|uniref:RING-type domain-containing protein n=1 Tax=Meloidogyne graminicola TaxID=189291 RepID=A0A8S9ZKQ2_9BILA|nr:RING-type domain-containing protein [Meloidogyne graminicola]
MSSFGRCIICTLSFELDDISTLRCGHTYHYECILTWINTSKSCPKCRTKNLVKDITRLYVDEPDKDKTLNQSSDQNLTSNVAELKLKIKKLESQNADLLDSNLAIEMSYEEVNKKNTEMKKIISDLKEESTNKLKIKENHIRHLENILEDQSAIKLENNALKRRLKTCDFYSLICKLSTNNDESEVEKAIDMYSTKDGDPSSGEFLKLIRKQLRIMENKNKELLRTRSQENNKKDREIQKLREEILQCRKRCLVQSNTNESPTAVRRMRPSFGFSFDDSEIQIISDVRSSSPVAIHKRSDPNASCQIVEEKKADHNKFRQYSIFDDSDDEFENAPSKPIRLENNLISSNLLAHASNYTSS